MKKNQNDGFPGYRRCLHDRYHSSIPKFVRLESPAFRRFASFAYYARSAEHFRSSPAPRSVILVVLGYRQLDDAGTFRCYGSEEELPAAEQIDRIRQDRKGRQGRRSG